MRCHRTTKFQFQFQFQMGTGGKVEEGQDGGGVTEEGKVRGRQAGKGEERLRFKSGSQTQMTTISRTQLTPWPHCSRTGQ